MRTLVAVLAGLAIGGCGQVLEREARQQLGDLLLDPNSAQFRELRASKEAICGEVNAKNRMGGYVGFKPFIVDRRGGTARIADDPGELLSYDDAAKAYEAVAVNLDISTRCPPAS